MDAITRKISEDVCIRMIDSQNRVTIPAKMMNGLKLNHQVYVAEPVESYDIVITNDGSRDDILESGKGFHRSMINGSYSNYSDNSKQYRVSLKTRVPEGKMAIVFRYDELRNEIIGTPI